MKTWLVCVFSQASCIDFFKTSCGGSSSSLRNEANTSYSVKPKTPTDLSKKAVT